MRYRLIETAGTLVLPYEQQLKVRSMNRSLALIVTTLLCAAPFATTDVATAGQQAQAQWDAVFQMTPSKSGATALEIADPMADIAAWMQPLGIKASSDQDALRLSGAQGFEEMRGALFDDASQWVDFLGGPVDMTLTLPAGDQPIRLELEARLTAGYTWEVISSGTGRYAQAGESTFEMRYSGPGAPAVQTIELQSQGTGDGIVRLAYRRAFDKEEPVHARMSLRVAATNGVIELTDPTPTEPTSADTGMPNDTGQASGEANPYAELLPKALPAAYDARTLGVIPPVRDQKSCGSCWAFGTAGVMETAVKKGGGPLTDLSEQFLISCNKDGWSCNGGLTASKYHFNTLGTNQTVAGAVLESVKPYTATNGTCPSAYAHPYKAAGWQFLTGAEWTMPTNDQIKNAIITYGAVTARVCVDSGWDSYSSGVYNPTSNACNGSINHQIVLVGWNDATQSWILRNSWGPSWGESGYMRIRYNPTGTNSRVGEGTSWIKYVGTAPTIPTTYSPAGDTYTNKPTYSWSRIAAAASYKLRVKDVAAGTYPINGVTVSSSYCSTATNRCSYTPSTVLTYNKSYQWQVAAGSGAYSALKAFVPRPGFSSQFNGSSAGWVTRPGGAWLNSGTTQYTTGVADKWSTFSYNQNFGNFTYQARVKRVGTPDYSSGVRVRGTPTFDSKNNQTNDYLFVYAVSGATEYFSVWKHVAGVTTPLKGWTTTTAVNPNAWNMLKVTTWGSALRFYINGVLVWSGTDPSFATGQVALTMYRSTTASRFDVDWATLGMSELYKASGQFAAEESVEAGQRHAAPSASLAATPERAPSAP